MTQRDENFKARSFVEIINIEMKKMCFFLRFKCARTHELPQPHLIMEVPFSGTILFENRVTRNTMKKKQQQISNTVLQIVRLVARSRHQK